MTAQLWKQRPELRQRVGREWTKEHYQNHRRDRTEKFIKEKVEVLERLMSAGGHTHLILAGHPTITSRVRSKLPKHLAEKLVDMVPASREAPDTDIVKTTLASFIEQEEDESRAAADEIERQIRTGGLAVSGTEASLQALRRQQADMLVIARSYSSASRLELYSLWLHGRPAGKAQHLPGMRWLPNCKTSTSRRRW